MTETRRKAARAYHSNVSGLRKIIDAHKETIKGLRVQNDNLKTRNKELNGHLVSLHQRVEDLEKQLAASQGMPVNTPRRLRLRKGRAND